MNPVERQGQQFNPAGLPVAFGAVPNIDLVHNRDTVLMPVLNTHRDRLIEAKQDARSIWRNLRHRGQPTRHMEDMREPYETIRNQVIATNARLATDAYFGLDPATPTADYQNQLANNVGNLVAAEHVELTRQEVAQSRNTLAQRLRGWVYRHPLVRVGIGTTLTAATGVSAATGALPLAIGFAAARAGWYAMGIEGIAQASMDGFGNLHGQRHVPLPAPGHMDAVDMMGPEEVMRRLASWQEIRVLYRGGGPADPNDTEQRLLRRYAQLISHDVHGELTTAGVTPWYARIGQARALGTEHAGINVVTENATILNNTNTILSRHLAVANPTGVIHHGTARARTLARDIVTLTETINDPATAAALKPALRHARTLAKTELQTLLVPGAGNTNYNRAIAATRQVIRAERRIQRHADIPAEVNNQYDLAVGDAQMVYDILLGTPINTAAPAVGGVHPYHDTALAAPRQYGVIRQTDRLNMEKQNSLNWQRNARAARWAGAIVAGTALSFLPFIGEGAHAATVVNGGHGGAVNLGHGSGGLNVTVNGGSHDVFNFGQGSTPGSYTGFEHAFGNHVNCGFNHSHFGHGGMHYHGGNSGTAHGLTSADRHLLQHEIRADHQVTQSNHDLIQSNQHLIKADQNLKTALNNNTAAYKHLNHPGSTTTHTTVIDSDVKADHQVTQALNQNTTALDHNTAALNHHGTTTTPSHPTTPGHVDADAKTDATLTQEIKNLRQTLKSTTGVHNSNNILNIVNVHDVVHASDAKADWANTKALNHLTHAVNHLDKDVHTVFEHQQVPPTTNIPLPPTGGAVQPHWGWVTVHHGNTISGLEVSRGVNDWQYYLPAIEKANAHTLAKYALNYGFTDQYYGINAMLHGQPFNPAVNGHWIFDNEKLWMPSFK